MATFTWAPDLSPSMTVTPRVRKTQFGDGYAQRAADGINNMPESWSLKFTNLDNVTYDAIVAFLVARKGTEAFLWTTPQGVQKQYICESWDGVPEDVDLNSLSLKFEQFFG